MSDIVDLLKDHEDFRRVEFAGDKRPWFVGQRSFTLIRQEDTEEVFERVWAALNEPFDPDEFEGSDAEYGYQAMERMCLVYYAGFKVFDPDLTYEEVELQFSDSDVEAFVNEITGTLETDQETKKKT